MTRNAPGYWIKNKFRLSVHSSKAFYNIRNGNEDTYFLGCNMTIWKFTTDIFSPVIFAIQQEYPMSESYQTVEEDQ